MDRLDAMELFARIVERRSFRRAAEDLGLPRATATDAMKRLEARLGVTLLARSTRQVQPTLDGAAYYQRCRAILAEVAAAEEAFAGAAPRGVLQIEAHGTLARHFLMPELPRFLAAHPGIALRLSEGDRLVDPLREGVDCLLRAGTPAESALVMRRVALLPEVTVAAPDYLARHGRPERLDALEGHRMVGFRSSATGAVLPLDFAEGAGRRAVSLPVTLTVEGAESYHAAALAGLGLIQLPRYHAEADLAAGRLVEILPAHPPAPMPVAAYYPQSRQLSPRVRVFIDWVVQVFARAETRAGG